MAELGNNRRVYIVTGTAQSPTYTVLAGEQTNNCNRTAEASETSDKSAVWAQFISGKKGATADVTVYTNDADAQQKAALNGLHTGATVKVFIGTLSTAATPAPTQGDLFEALVTAISDTNDNGAVASRSLSRTATGAVTHTPAIS
jgi:hypothetical protein